MNRNATESYVARSSLRLENTPGAGKFTSLRVFCKELFRVEVSPVLAAGTAMAQSPPGYSYTRRGPDGGGRPSGSGPPEQVPFGRSSGAVRCREFYGRRLIQRNARQKRADILAVSG